MDAPAVELRGVSKSFGGVRVLDRVDLTLRGGETHVLAGGNGAGKSTLMKILQGVHTPDEGEILVGGQPARIGSSQAARAHGIAMIFQEFSLIPTLTVAQNVFLTREQRGRAGLLNDRAGARRTAELLADMGVDLDPDATVGSLSTAYWQLTEIAKALSQEAQVLIMDEPTASLASGETERLFTLIRRLRDRGISIVYISHRMGEIFQVADRITVLRDGRRVVTANAADLTSAELVDHIAGRRMEQAMQWTPRQVPRQGTPLLEVSGLTAGRLRGVGFTLYPGEVLGVAGLMGSGRSTLLRTLFGVHRAAGGQVLVNGRPVRIRRPRDAVAAGVALVPEDRRAQGLVLGHSVRDNLLLPLLGRLSGGGVIDDRKGDQVTGSLVRDLDIHTTSTARPVGLLSGGNQQKVVLAKWLGTSPEILLLDEPTAGVDISTKTEIVAKIRELADTGKGIVIVSSELPELLAVSDRVLILRDGRVDAHLDRGDIPSEDALHLAVQGVEMPDAPERPVPEGGSWGPAQDDDEKERDDG